MDSELSVIIGDRISQLLSDKGIKQKDLAEYLGIPDNTISYFCSGRRMPNTGQIKALAQYFDVSADYLLGSSGAATSNKDIQYIGDYLGLSAEAINNLNSWFNDTEVLNFMLETAYPFIPLCSEIKEYKDHNTELHDLMNKVINSGDCSSSEVEEFERLSDSADLSRFRIQQAFNTLIDMYSDNPTASTRYDQYKDFWKLYSNYLSIQAGDSDGDDQETQ